MSNSNPFDRPGLGQGSAANPIMQSLDMMNKAWQQFAQVQNAGNTVFSMPTAMNADDLDKRIQELKSIESWLTMNLSMLSSTIQGLEIQRASIHTFKTFVDTLQTQNHDRSLDDILGLKKPSTDNASRQSTSDTTKDADTKGKKDSKADSADNHFSTDSVNHAAQAWWDMLQNQFTQLSQVATQATQAMHKEPAPVKTPPGPEPDEPADPGEPVKPTTRKRSAASTSRSASKRNSPGRNTA